MIYTSYFGNVKKLKLKMPQLVLVSIAGKTPDWFDGKRLPELMPKLEWWKEWNDNYKDKQPDCGVDFYTEKYYETVLSQTDPESIASRLKCMADGKDVCLLCYETPANFCHRQLVAEWLNNAGIACIEWNEYGCQFNWSKVEDDLRKCKNFIENIRDLKVQTHRARIYHDTEDLEEMCDQLDSMKDKAWKVLMDITY